MQRIKRRELCCQKFLIAERRSVDENLDRLQIAAFLVFFEQLVPKHSDGGPSDDELVVAEKLRLDVEVQREMVEPALLWS